MRRFAVSDPGDASAKAAGHRLSRLQQRILCWLDAEARRTDRVFASSHQHLVQALPHAKGNISHSLRRLEVRGLVAIGRSPGGQAAHVRLTSEGCQKALELAGSYD